MKKTLIRIFAICLVLLIALPILCACKTNGTENESQTDTDVVIDIETETDSDGKVVEDEKTQFMPERIDYQGATFIIANDIGNKKQYIAPIEGASMAADAVNMAFNARNTLIEKYYNVKIKIVDYPNNYQCKDELDINSMSGTDFADIMYSVAGSILNPAISNGYVVDLNTLDALNLEASYYDQRIQEEYLIEGKLFCIEGDFNLHDELRTHVVAVNRTMYNSFRYNETYGSTYDLVMNKKWTIDVMFQMAKNTSDYATLGANMTKDSQWAILSESPFPYVVYLGTGKKIVETVDGTLVCNLTNDSYYGTTLDILQKCCDLVFKDPEILLADAAGSILSTSNNWGEVQSMFASGKALFRTSTLVDFTQYADMEDDFGILPVPLYEEGQEEYYSWCTGLAHSPLIIPRTAEGHIDRTSHVIEGMAFFSKYMTGNNISVTDAFYEKMTHAKLCRSAQDYEVLQLIFAYKTYDIDQAINFSGICYKINNAAKNPNYSIPADLEASRLKLLDTSIDTNTMLKFLDNMWKNYQ